MARSVAALLLLAGLTVGCQQRTSMINPLPAPNLDGPVVVAPRPPDAAARGGPGAKTVPGPQGNARIPDVPDSWAPAAPANNWQWIVIHHSATPAGSAAVFDRMHRQKGWDELGYHFVIGNGTASGDGVIEVGSRWPKQKWGAHAKTADNRFNDYGIGICLVGNFDIDRPTAAQMRSLSKLVAYLMVTYHIPATRVLGHGQTKPTDCPGRNLHVAEVRLMAEHLAQGWGVGPLPAHVAASGEMLRSAH